MPTVIFAAFRDHALAGRAVDELNAHGFDPHDLSVISREQTVRRQEPSPAADTVGGAASGAVTGGVVGGLAGLLAGAGIFPALAGLFIGGPIAAALGLTGIAAATVSGAVTGAAAGGLVGALMGLGLSETDAKYYNETVESGGLILVTPVSDANVAEARAILEANRAEQIRDVSLTDQQYASVV